MVIFVALFTFSVASWAETKISPQFVVERVLGEGREAKQIDLREREAAAGLFDVRGLYDWTVSGSYNYEDSRSVNLSGLSNVRDLTSNWSLVNSKRLPTGTIFSLAYGRIQQNSVFRSFGNQSNRSPYVVYDEAKISVSQDLLGNFFGIAERSNLRSAERKVEAAGLQRKEEQEALVLVALGKFWDTYVARESLNEAMNQRSKYEALVKEVEQKARLGFANPGDLPKARAEFAAQVRNVKSASFHYLRNLEDLLTTMRFDEREVKLEVSQELPPLPRMEEPSVDGLRQVEANRVFFESAQMTKSATDISVRFPELKLVASASYTGSEPTAGKAFSAVTGGDSPKYSIGLVLNYRFFSDQYLASQTRADVGMERAYHNLAQAKERLTSDNRVVMDQVRFAHASALSAIEAMEQWERAVRAQESSYRQGRLDFSQLIQDYNAYYRARSEKIRAIGDYQIALHRYAAGVDQLVK
jgi:outer membrane protein TolC